MPQMSPMNWMFLFMFFNSILFSVLMKGFFFSNIVFCDKNVGIASKPENMSLWI